MQKAVEIFAERLGFKPSRIERDQIFATDLNADSLDLIELIMACEDAYDLDIRDEDAEKIQTVGQALDYLAKQGVAAEYLEIAD